MLGEGISVLSNVSFDDFVFLMQEHQYLVSVLVPFFTGEFSVHIFGMLYGSGDISLLPAVIAAVSMVVFDTIIYSVVQILKRRNSTFERFRRIAVFAKVEKLFRKCENRYSKHPLLLLIAIKLMPMTKVTIIFFSMCQRLSIVRFIVQDTIITAVWVCIVFLPGWFVGKEFLTQEAGRRVSVFIIYFLLLVVVMLLFGERIDRAIMSVVNKFAKMLDRLRGR